MGDKAKAVAALTVATKTCAAALSALSKRDEFSDQQSETDLLGNSPRAPPDTRDASLQTLLTDYSSLLSLVYASTTKIALVLKPASPTYSAVVAPLRDVTKHIDSLASCACTINPDTHGKTLAREIRWASEGVVSSLHVFLECFSDESLQEGYLIKAGAVHEAIERARSVSKSNREAVKKRWEADRDGLNDCVKEVAEMVEEENEGGDGSDGDNEDEHLDDDDDDWGELGAGPFVEKHAKATPEELARLNEAHLLLKFILGLHKRVLNAFISQTVFPLPTTSVLDEMQHDSDALLRAADDLVPALYIPQDLETLTARVTSLNEVLLALRARLIRVGLPPPPDEQEGVTGTCQGNASGLEAVSEKMSSMALQSRTLPQIAQRDDAKLSDKALSESRWINTCFSHIYKSIDTLTVA